MKNLKLILLFSIALFVIYNSYNKITNYKYDNKEIKYIEGKVKNVKDNKFIINDAYIINDSKTKVINGDYVKVYGVKSEPSINTNFNLFNFKNYLLSKQVYYVYKVNKIKIIRKHKPNIIEKRLNSINNSYLDTLLIGNNIIDEETYESYKINGITHLFAISGMHISILSAVFLNLLNKIFKNKKISYFITSGILVIYMFITNMSASIIRSTLLFICLSINKIFNFKTKPIVYLLLILLLLIYINPFYIYDIGFKYSFIISFFLLYLKPNKLYKVSLLAFFIGFPITINSSYSINLLSPLINIIFVPFFTFIIFPLSLITFIVPYLNPVLTFFINILEFTNKLIATYNIDLIFKYMNPFLVLIYYLIFIISIKKKKFYLLIIYFIIHYNMFYIYPRVTMIDVKRGDSFLIELPFNKGNILIDTGGSDYYDINKNVLTPFLKSKGIKKINYLFLTHGDLDHMGSSINLLKSYKVDNVFTNSYSDTDLEKQIKKKNKISKHTLNINGYLFYFLNKPNKNENEDSLIIYTVLNSKKLLFMGDATIKEEEYLLNSFELNNIDILKVGHHGSKTSSSKYFIDTIKPRYSLISVDKNNIYGHPHESVLNNLKNTKIYRTDQKGSVTFILKEKLKIKTCVNF